jgi:hypothetical protein
MAEVVAGRAWTGTTASAAIPSSHICFRISRSIQGVPASRHFRSFSKDHHPFLTPWHYINSTPRDGWFAMRFHQQSRQSKTRAKAAHYGPNNGRPHEGSTSVAAQKERGLAVHQFGIGSCVMMSVSLICILTAAQGIRKASGGSAMVQLQQFPR